MIVSEETVVLKILEPSTPGKWLTDGKTFSQKVYLAREASADDWWEITEEEKEDMERGVDEND